MRRTILLVGVLLSAVALGSDSPKEYSDAVKQELEGQWRLVSFEEAGQWRPGRSGQRTFRGGHWVYDDCWGNTFSGLYTTDTSRTPAYFNQGAPRAAQDIKCIYQVDGDTLRLAYAQNGNERPKGFQEKGVVVTTWEHLKK